MLITLFTDASYCSRTRLAAYAIWAKGNGRAVRHVGLLRERVTNSSTAETMAVVNGIHVALAVLRPERGSKIIAQTDCVTAIAMLSAPARKKASRAVFDPLRASYTDRVNAAGVTVEFRHVKGHKGNATPRNAVNTWADKECRRLLRQARKELAALAATVDA